MRQCHPHSSTEYALDIRYESLVGTRQAESLLSLLQTKVDRHSWVFTNDV